MRGLIEDSYDLVVAGLPRAARRAEAELTAVWSCRVVQVRRGRQSLETSALIVLVVLVALIVLAVVAIGRVVGRGLVSRG